MPNEFSGSEKREFFRYKHEKPVNYKTITAATNKNIATKLIEAVSKNLSASGILFSSKYLPELSSILVLDLDYRTSKVCQEIEDRALIINDKLFGKVVRIEDTDNGSYDVGVAFIKKSEDIPEEIRELAK